MLHGYGSQKSPVTLPFELMVVWLEQLTNIPIAEFIVILMWFIFIWGYWGIKYTIKTWGCRPTR